MAFNINDITNYNDITAENSTDFFNEVSKLVTVSESKLKFKQGKKPENLTDEEKNILKIFSDFSRLGTLSGLESNQSKLCNAAKKPESFKMIFGIVTNTTLPDFSWYDSYEKVLHEHVQTSIILKNENNDTSIKEEYSIEKYDEEVVDLIKSLRDNPRSEQLDIIDFLRIGTKFSINEIDDFVLSEDVGKYVTELNSYNDYILKIRIATVLSNYESFLEDSLDTFKKNNSLKKKAVVDVYKKADTSNESSESEDVLLSSKYPKMSDFIESCIEGEKQTLLNEFRSKDKSQKLEFEIDTRGTAADLNNNVLPKIQSSRNALIISIYAQVPEDKRSENRLSKTAFDALDQLKSIGAKGSINETIKTLKTLDKSIYTDEINEKLLALENNKNVTQEELNDIITELSSNMVALIKKSEEKTNNSLIDALEAYKSLASIIYANDHDAKEIAESLIQGKIDSLKNGTKFESNDRLKAVLEKLQKDANAYNPNNDSKLPFDRLTLADKNNLKTLAKNLISSYNDYNLDEKNTMIESFKNLIDKDSLNEQDKKDLGDLLNTIIILSNKALKRYLEGRETIAGQQKKIKTLEGNITEQQNKIIKFLEELKDKLPKRYQDEFQRKIAACETKFTLEAAKEAFDFYSDHHNPTRIILFKVLTIVFGSLFAALIALYAATGILIDKGQNAVQNYEEAIIAAATTDAEDGNRNIEFSLPDEIPLVYKKFPGLKRGFEDKAKPMYEAKYYYKLGYSDGVAAGKIANEAGEYKELDTANIPTIDGLSTSYNDNYKEGYAAGYNATHQKTVTKTETITETITETVTVDEYEQGHAAGLTQGKQIAKTLNASPASSTQDPLERHYMQYGGEASNNYVDGYNAGLKLGFLETIKEKQNNQNAVNYSVEDILKTLRTHTKFENPEIYEIKVNAASNSLIIITKEGSKYKKTTVTPNDSSLIQTLNNTAKNVKQDDSSIDDQNYLNALYNVFLGDSEITTNSYVVVESENVEFDHLKQYAASKTDDSGLKNKIEQLSSSGEAVKIHISILDKKAVVYAISGTHELSVEFETPANVSKNYIIDSLEDIFIGSAAEKNEAEAKFIVNEPTVEENAQLNAIYIFNANTAESTVS